MGVVRTDTWLENDFHNPKKICKQIYSNSDFYSYLVQFGMYKPNRKSWRNFLWLKEQKVWEYVEKLFKSYQVRWDGPEVDIYIFPIESGLSFRNGARDKGGVALKGQMFLFIGEVEDEKEIEALFVHEYHHVCRMDRQNKDTKEYTLLDSMVLEGLAENAVEHYCGKDYLAKWCDFYTPDQLQQYWEDFLKDNLNIKRDNKQHDLILFGKNRYPRLVGYSFGYYLTRNNFQKINFSAKINFDSPSEYFINRNKIF